LNCRLDDATLVSEIRKPFDVLAKGLISKDSRGNRTAIELFLTALKTWPDFLLVSGKRLLANSSAEAVDVIDPKKST
jgi:hypothetical protein